MKLTVRDVIELFKVSEKTVYRWIYEDEFPASQVHGQYRINPTELMEWAAARQIPIPAGLFRKKEKSAQSFPALSEALERGGIFHDVGGNDKPTVLRAAVQSMRLPEGVDREDLLGVLLAREGLGSTGIGDGIAVPHVRNPIIFPVPQSSLTLCFLQKPVDFGALDGKPVHSLFTLVSHTVRVHLHLLSQLAFALRQPAFGDLVQKHAPAAEIIQAAREAEGIPH